MPRESQGASGEPGVPEELRQIRSPEEPDEDIALTEHRMNYSHPE
jgi:hypothetical protein